ncbi:MAG: thiamine-phosphate kinase [Candidatus Methanofastidiosa archaeon]|nr:thiamine-phosphate kinase [Candidatus Methanofastidiosa archaeon]
MRISELGGEFALIRRLAEKQSINDPSIVKSIGDDCAVIDNGKEEYLLITADMIVENDHFNTRWYTPDQIGRKLVECNVSDIVSMGGWPKYGIVSMSIKKETELEFIDGLYNGIYQAASKHGFYVVGGDTAHGTEMVFNMTIIGYVKKNLLRTRSMALVGDLICVTGRLGGSKAGLMMLSNGYNEHIDEHLNPVSRTRAEGEAIARYANAMIDVSDGLGSEVAHICEESGVGARIYKENIPLSKNALAASEILSSSPYDYALYGGEDFEIVFTIPENKIEALKRDFYDFTVVGKIVDESEGKSIIDDGKEMPIGSGFDHFL